jgi:hypothetical protein
MYVFYMRRTREKLGVVRVSTAYQFFEAVEDHLVFKGSSYEKKAKPPFEATGEPISWLFTMFFFM